MPAPQPSHSGTALHLDWDPVAPQFRVGEADNPPSGNQRERQSESLEILEAA